MCRDVAVVFPTPIFPIFQIYGKTLPHTKWGKRKNIFHIFSLKIKVQKQFFRIVEVKKSEIRLKSENMRLWRHGGDTDLVEAALPLDGGERLQVVDQ